MRWLISTLLLLSLTLGQARALELGHVRGTEQLRLLVTDRESYPFRLENVLSLKGGPVWVLDLFQWDRAGYLKGKMPRNQVNNKLAVGLDLWNGLGPVYELQNQWTKLPVNRFGVGHRRTWDFGGITLLNAAEALVATTGDSYHFRVSDFALLRHSSGLWANDLFTGDFGNGHRLNNKINVGFELPGGISLALERQDTTGSPTLYGAGVQGRF